MCVYACVLVVHEVLAAPTALPASDIAVAHSSDPEQKVAFPTVVTKVPVHAPMAHALILFPGVLIARFFAGNGHS